MVQRIDWDIYDQDTFNKIVGNLIEKYQVSVRYYENFKIKDLDNKFKTSTWFSSFTPYTLIIGLLETAVGGSIVSGKEYTLESVHLDRETQFFNFDVDVRWCIHQVVCTIEMYNEMMNNPSTWPIVIHTSDQGESLIHPGNNRWFISQFPECSNIECTLINIDYNKIEETNIFENFDKFKKGIRVVEYDEIGFPRNIEFHSPQPISLCYGFTCTDPVSFNLENDKLYINGVHVVTFSHGDKTAKINILDQDEILKVIEPSYSYIHREELFYDHEYDLSSGKLENKKYVIDQHIE